MKNKQIQNKKVQEKRKVFKKVFMKPGNNNQEDRLNFIKFWAEYIKTHSDEDWSKQQNIVIDSQIE